jgi:hypothetical protein
MRSDSGFLAPLQNLVIPQSRGATLEEAITQSLADIEAGAEQEGSAIDEVVSLVRTTLNEKSFKPNGDHLAGRNIETELLAIKESWIQLRDDESQPPEMRAVAYPEIVKTDLKLAARDFMRPIRDVDWKADLNAFVARMAPHSRNFVRQVKSTEPGVPDSEVYGVHTVSLKIDTLRAEVDEYGEICAWTYSETQVL